MARVLPQVTDWNRFYWTSGEDGRLRFQHCSACESLQHPAGPRCRRCRSDQLEVREVSGDGVVQSCTTNFQQWSPDMPVPYSVAVVAIEEDPRIRVTTNIVGCDAGDVSVGMRVRVAFEHVEDVWLPMFAPAGGEPAPLPDELDDLERFQSVRPMAHLEKFEDDVAVSGIGMSRLGRKLMVDPVSLSVEAIERAVRDAGLTLQDIDGLSTYPAGTADGGYSEGGVTAVESALGLRPTWHNGASETPGAAGSLIAAMLAVSSGLCRHVVCFRTVWQSTAAEMAKRAGGGVGGGRRRASGSRSTWRPSGCRRRTPWPWRPRNTSPATAPHERPSAGSLSTRGPMPPAIRRRCSANPSPWMTISAPDRSAHHLACSTAIRSATDPSPSWSPLSMPPATCAARPFASRRWGCRSPSPSSGTKACSAMSPKCWGQRRTCGAAPI